jgi:hypothetical protein
MTKLKGFLGYFLLGTGCFFAFILGVLVPLMAGSEGFEFPNGPVQRMIFIVGGLIVAAAGFWLVRATSNDDFPKPGPNQKP